MEEYTVRKMKKGAIAVAFLAAVVMFGSVTTACGPDGGATHTHSLAKTAAVAATCLAAGNTEYYICSDCGKLFADAEGAEEITAAQAAVAALGHDLSVTEHDDAEHWHKCSRCDVIDAKEAHKGGTATCASKATCEVCGTAYGELAAHVYDNEVVGVGYLRSAAACIAKATYYKSCECGAFSTEATFEAGEALGHDFTVSRHDEAAHWHQCSRCDETSAKEAHRGGTFGPEGKAVCEVCGVEYIAHTDHVYDREVADVKYLMTAATCTEKAVYYKSCVCGDFRPTGATFEGEALGHDFGVTEHDETQHWRQCSRCGEKTAKGDHRPDRQEFFDHDQLCSVCGRVMEEAIYKPLAAPVLLDVKRDVDANNSKGITDPKAGTTEIVYQGETHAANLYSFSGLNNKYLIIKGGGIVGTADAKAALNPKVGYIFANQGDTPITFKYYYEHNALIPGTTETITLAPGESTYAEFTVKTNIFTKEAYTRIHLGADVTDAKLALVGYRTGTMRADAYRLALPENMTFADGVAEKIVTVAVADELCRELAFTVPYGADGFRNALDNTQVWPADADGFVAFRMPANDVKLIPYSLTGEWQAKKIAPRATGGGKNPPLNVNIGSVAAGTVDNTSEGYSDIKALYTIDVANAGKAGTKIVSGCGSYIGRSDTADRLVRVTFTRVAGSIAFTHYIDVDGKKDCIAYSTFDVRLDEAHNTATAYFVIPKGLDMGAGKHIFMTVLEDMAANASFVMEVAAVDIA